MTGLTLGGTSIGVGERRKIEIPVARLPTGTWTSVALEVLRGVEAGPTVWLSGAIHGDEIDGVDIIRRVSRFLDPAALRGTVIAVPIVNIFGFVSQSRYLPDRRDLNRSFPGSSRGSLAARLANLLMSEVVAPSDVGIDYHCGSDDRVNLPQVRCSFEDSETTDLMRAFAAPVSLAGTAPKGSLRSNAVKQGKRVLLFEGGEARRFTAESVAVGVEGTLRVLHHLGMVDEAPPVSEYSPVECHSSKWVRASEAGMFQPETRLGARVRKGQVLGVISDSFGDRQSLAKAPVAGVVIGLRMNPLVNRGDAVAHLGVLGSPPTK